jgi:hypothetical protein
LLIGEFAHDLLPAQQSVRDLQLRIAWIWLNRPVINRGNQQVMALARMKDELKEKNRPVQARLV